MTTAPPRAVVIELLPFATVGVATLLVANCTTVRLSKSASISLSSTLPKVLVEPSLTKTLSV
ncbi:hypothetical protein D3C80_1808500 [compost metagenome]